MMMMRQFTTLFVYFVFIPSVRVPAHLDRMIADGGSILSLLIRLIDTLLPLTELTLISLDDDLVVTVVESRCESCR